MNWIILYTLISIKAEKIIKSILLEKDSCWNCYDASMSALLSLLWPISVPLFIYLNYTNRQ